MLVFLEVEGLESDVWMTEWDGNSTYNWLQFDGTHFLLLNILSRGTSTHERKHADMPIKRCSTHHSRVPWTPRNIKTPLSCSRQLINNLKVHNSIQGPVTGSVNAKKSNNKKVNGTMQNIITILNKISIKLLLYLSSCNLGIRIPTKDTVVLTEGSQILSVSIYMNLR